MDEHLVGNAGWRSSRCVTFQSSSELMTFLTNKTYIACWANNAFLSRFISKHPELWLNR